MTEFQKKMMYELRKICLTGILLCGFVLSTSLCAQEEGYDAGEPEENVIENPTFIYNGSSRKYVIGGISVSGVDDYDETVLKNLSGLSEGQTINVPEDVTDAVRRYWKHGMFSYVSISSPRIVGNKIYLDIQLALRPKVSGIVFHGIKKGESDDLEEKIGLIKGGHVTPNMMDRAERLIKRYYDGKGFKNAEIRVAQRDDPDAENRVFVDVFVDKKEKVKVNSIILKGNELLSDVQIKKSMKKTNEKGNLRDFFRSKKFIDKEYENDKNNIITKYNEMGYRDAYIVEDSVVSHDDKTVDVFLTIFEGNKYYLRNIEWVGNTVYNSDQLSELLKMEPGDVYDQTKLDDRLNKDEDAVGRLLYYNNGYVFCRIDPVEVNVENDSIDLQIRISEGSQATINKVSIYGNDRVYENVVRRELYTRPGDLFTTDAMERSFRQIGQMGHFNPQSIQYDIKPDMVNGTVDIDWNLESKANDQIELSAGWGQTGVIGRVALKFTNFSMFNLFHKSTNRRFLLPQGDGQTFSISGQTNGSYYHSYSISFMEPWLGGNRPNTLSFGFFYSKQTDISDNYYNSSYYNNYMQYMYGIGQYGNGVYGGNYYNYESFYDPDKSFSMLGASIGWGTRLRWPDDLFTLYAELSYTRYNLKDWSYFLINNGSCNNLSLNIVFGRNSTDNAIYPRVGSDISFSVSLTPPYSLFDGVNYEGLASDRSSATYQQELQQKHKWIEYHKWKFKARTYTSLTSGQKRNLVLMTRFEFGILGSYNRFKRSPFETFYVGGDGMSGASYAYATETIGLRGYENGCLTPSGEGYAYSRMSAELRYPLMMENATTIYALAFVEGGNAWTDIKSFNPFDMKRSAGVGVRVFLPMIGMMGLDWAYGFDPVYGTRQYGGSQIHFILGQEF